MATIQEIKVQGRKYRVWDEFLGLWKRISYWTKAADVEFESGKNAEETVSEISNDINELQTDLDNVETSLDVFSFRNNEGQAQYSMDDGTTWKDFKHPVGTKSITANGVYDVTDYASVNVNVPKYNIYKYTVTVVSSKSTITLTKPDGTTKSVSVNRYSNDNINLGPVHIFEWEHDGCQVSFHGVGYLNNSLINTENNSNGYYVISNARGTYSTLIFECLGKA